jgi:hypothetical protein
MTGTPGCRYETDVFDLVWTGRWPARADATLQAHVADCPICRDLAAVASAIGDLDDRAATVKVPDASAVWYSAQARARLEMSRRAARPVLLAEAAALLCGLAGLFVAWHLAGPSLGAWLARVRWPEGPTLPGWSDVTAMTGATAFPWVAGAALAWALLIPAAMYVARLADGTPERHHDRS